MDFHIPTFKGMVQFWVNVVPTYPESTGCFPYVFMCSLNSLCIGKMTGDLSLAQLCYGMSMQSIAAEFKIQYKLIKTVHLL